MVEENSYVLLNDNNIIGTIEVSFNGEKTYEHIYNWEWLSNDKYAVVHRITIDDNYFRSQFYKLSSL